MKRSAISLALLSCAVVSFGCGRSAAPEEHADEHQDEHKDEHKDEHGAEVTVPPEAAERAGIKVGAVERRAIGGGHVIPAEVQFEPSSTAHVGPLVPGRFTKVAVGLGEKVKEGQLLAVVSSSDVSSARARLEQARARLAATDAALKRQQQLSSEGIGAQRSLDEAAAQSGEIRAEVAGLVQQLSVFGSGASGELRLTSPINGVVVDLHATLGETANADEPAFVVTDPTRVWMRGSVPELEIENVKVGASAVVRLHAFSDLVLTGKVTYVAPALDERTRALPIRVTLDAPDPRLRGGLFGTIEIAGEAGQALPLVVPADAVASVDGQSVVFVPADEPNTYKPAPVKLGRRAGGFYAVEEGIREGDKVVLSGAFTLKSALKSGELSEGHAH